MANQQNDTLNNSISVVTPIISIRIDFEKYQPEDTSEYGLSMSNDIELNTSLLIKDSYGSLMTILNLVNLTTLYMS